jgi:hypothetical protein
MSATSFEKKIDSYPLEIQKLARAVRALVTELLPDVEETVDASAPVVGYGYGSGYKGLVCTLILSRSSVKLGLTQGATLPDPNHLLQGAGKVHRHIPFETAADLQRTGIRPLVRAAARRRK